MKPKKEAPNWRDLNVEIPSLEQIMEWSEEDGCETPDGCWVEPDGICEHGYKSWMLIIGVI